MKPAFTENFELGQGEFGAAVKIGVVKLINFE